MTVHIDCAYEIHLKYLLCNREGDAEFSDLSLANPENSSVL